MCKYKNNVKVASSMKRFKIHTGLTKLIMTKKLKPYTTSYDNCRKNICPFISKIQKNESNYFQNFATIIIFLS